MLLSGLDRFCRDELNLKDILVTSTCNWKLVEVVGVERIRVGGNRLKVPKKLK